MRQQPSRGAPRQGLGKRVRGDVSTLPRGPAFQGQLPPDPGGAGATRTATTVPGGGAGGFSPAKPGKASTVREQTLRRCGVPCARRRQGRAGEALGRGPLPPQLGVQLGRSPSPQPCRSSFLISLGFWGLVAEAQCPRGPVTWAVPACVIAKFYQRQTAGRTRSGAETLGSVSFLGWTFQRGAGSTALLGGCGSSARRQGRAGHPQSRVQITELHVQKRTRRL